MYTLRGITKRYARGKSTVDALAGVDLTIEDGGRLVIQGPTGGGKSTLLQMLGGLDRPTSGSVELDGVDLAKLGEAKLTKVRAENIGFVFQSFNLIPTLTAQENVETALVPLGGKAAERRSRAAEALESVGLGERLGHLPGEMSGASSSGWRSRGHWSSGRRYRSPTSPPATSTSRCATRSWRCWRPCGRSTA
ncbi:ATP-binding cassette domain-containing protein [Streptomyces sp. NBC_00893]|uniref:ABC transporter ATP-binding protein n=1 Tax=Streptomyces sp. NBC_00893 TaxID=2975862 RepID=UPI00338F68A3